VAQLSREYGRRPKVLTEDLLAILSAQPWPGNVRELRNTIERLVIMTAGDEIGPGDLPRPAEPQRPREEAPVAVEAVGPFTSLAQARDDFERRYIQKVYEEAGGNMSRTAEALQVERSNLYRKMKAFGLLPARRVDE
jgi:two-component system nitrogen regulation response regulator NtrX